MDKSIKNPKAIAKNPNISNNNKEDNPMFANNETQTATKKHSIRNFSSKAKLTLSNLANSDRVKKIKATVIDWIDNLPRRLSDACLRGLLIGIVLNIIASYFWPELPETIPTIYGFFNGFVTLGEFLYKAALGGIASLFNGNFTEFGNTMMTEIGELWNAFITWISAISF